MIDLSIIIVSYNTKETTKQCLDKLQEALSAAGIKAEIIIADNSSTDGSVEMLKEVESQSASWRIKFKIILNKENLGFSKANNKALKIAEGKYILFLNSDVLIQNLNFEDLLYYLNKNSDVGALTVKVVLPSGKLDLASHRGFPTIWRSFAYFTKLGKLFSKIPLLSKYFCGYHLLNFDLNSIHEVEAISGAFYLTRKKILDNTGGFDEQFFMYGEDLDLSYQIKKMGYRIIYYPLFNVVHLKYQSGLKKGNKKTKTKTKIYFYDAMKLFYKKHFAAKNPEIANRLIYFFISLKKIIS